MAGRPAAVSRPILVALIAIAFATRATFNAADSGVILHNITAKQLQDMMSITKTTNALGQGIVNYFPQAFIDNTLAAFDLAPGKTVDKNAP